MAPTAHHAHAHVTATSWSSAFFLDTFLLNSGANLNRDELPPAAALLTTAFFPLPFKLLSKTRPVVAEADRVLASAKPGDAGGDVGGGAGGPAQQVHVHIQSRVQSVGLKKQSNDIQLYYIMSV